jgi:hypothetical protein
MSAGMSSAKRRTAMIAALAMGVAVAIGVLVLALTSHNPEVPAGAAAPASASSVRAGPVRPDAPLGLPHAPPLIPSSTSAKPAPRSKDAFDDRDD